MEVLSTKIKESCCMGIGLGNFDGLHIGHMELIKTLIKESNKNNYKSLIYTFLIHPENILRKELFTTLITPRQKKIELLKETKLDYIFFEEFNERFSRLDPESFVNEILVNKLKAKLIVAGEDYRFGYGAHGDMEFLEKMSKKYGYNVICVPDVKIDNKKVSSTYIRNLLNEGSIERANEFLGRKFSLKGLVIRGKKLGRKLGFPTANIKYEKSLVKPINGVYITKTLLEETYYDSVTNIGLNPTFDNDRITIETYVLDFKKNFYNKEIEIFFYKRLRDEAKFDSLEGLVEQIKKDVLDAKSFFKNTKLGR